MLTKEECENVVDKLHGYLRNDDIILLKILIKEHFDNPEITSISAYRILRYKIDELEKENELLKRENKALADDNEMKCELNEKLSKEVAELKRMMKTFK